MNDVTIVVTTCDRPEYLAECLASLPDVRVIVVDDSTDHPYGSSYRPEDNRVQAICRGAEYIRTPGHIGTSAARMLGLAQCRSRFFAFFDDDDVMLPNWLPLHLENALRADVVGSWHYQTDGRLQHRELRQMAPTSKAALMALRVTISDNSLIRASALRGLTWHPERKHVMMLTMWLALMHKGVRFAMIEEPTWLYRIHATNQTPSTRDPQDALWRAQAVAEYAS